MGHDEMCPCQNRVEIVEDIWHRCEVRSYSVADEWGDHLYTGHKIDWYKFKVDSYTPKGVWLRGPYGEKFFVNGMAKKQRAVPTKALAIADEIARRKVHVLGCEARLLRAKHMLKLVTHEGMYNDKLTSSPS